MKTIFKWLTALMIVAAVSAYAYADNPTAANSGKLRKGEMVDLSTQNIVWQKGDTVVAESGNRYYYLKTDDQGHAMVIRRVHDLSDFVADNYSPSHVTAGVFWNPWFGFYPYYPWYSTVVIHEPIFYHRYVVVHPRVSGRIGIR
ncbi:MAG TPA: hypothetical protein VE978_22670 [Chitinophagales bacterium]|nr:hypothetical protein [Chitinophagales bacterium]